MAPASDPLGVCVPKPLSEGLVVPAARASALLNPANAPPPAAVAASPLDAQHIAVLCKMAIVSARTEKGNTFYSLRDPAFSKILEAMREYFLGHLTEALALLREEPKFDDEPSAAPESQGGRPPK